MQEKQKDHYNARTNGKALRLVIKFGCTAQQYHVEKSKKLHRPWMGPFHVLERLSESFYRSSISRLPGSGWWCTLIG